MAEQLDLNLNVTTQVADSLTTQTVNLLRFSAGEQSKIIDMLTGLEQELLAAIEKNVGKSQFTQGRLDALLKQTRETIATAYEKISEKSSETNTQVAQVAGDKAVGALNTAIGADVASVDWTDAQLAAIADNTVIQGSFADDWWSKQGDNLQDKFTQEMQMGLLRGESIQDLQARIRGTAANGYTDGIMDVPKSQAEALVRTSAQSVANSARMEAYKSNDSVIKGVQWVSTLDDRTTEECMALDGLEWQFPDGDGEADYVDYEPVDHDKEFEPPPIHWNCRSVVVPVTYSWEELAQNADDGDEEAAAAADAIPDDEETRASMDGQVAQSMTFEDWLGTKPEGFQNEVLGEQVADLWRDGKIDLKGLTDQSNNPLSLEQLKAKAGQPVEPEAAKTEPLLTTPIKTKTENPNEGTNPSFEITFTDGNKAMFKPQDDESAFHLSALIPHTELPPAQAIAQVDILPLADREVANSDIAKMVGMNDLVPNTVMRQIDGQWGSLQQWSFGSVNGMDESNVGPTRHEYNFGSHPEDVARAAAWDYFTGNLDRHGGNWMVNEETGKLSLIDNGISFGEFHGRGAPNSELIDKAAEDQQKVPEDVKKWVEKWPDIEAYMKDKGFTDAEVGAAQQRLHTLATNDNFADVTEEGYAQRAEAFNAEEAAAKSGAGFSQTPSETARLDAEIEAAAAKEAADQAAADAAAAKEAADAEAKAAADQAAADAAAKAALPEPPALGLANLEATVVNEEVNPASGANISYTLDLADGSKAIYKPVSGEDPSLGFRLGVHDEGAPTMAQREAANSGIAKILDFDMVPNTIMRWEGGTKEGSVQEWMQGYKTALEFTNSERWSTPGAPGALSMEDHSRAAAWDWFTGQADRHDANWMISGDTGKPGLIDNGLSFTARGDTDSNLLSQAKQFDLPIPPEVKEWQAKWPEVKTYLEEKGFTPLEIERTQFRLDDMANRQAAGQTFADVGSGRPIPEIKAPEPPAEPPAKPVPDLEQPIKTINVNMSGGVNNSYIIEFEDGTKGIYKPTQGENILATDNDKAPMMAGREVASSGVANILGIDEVPHTIMTDIEHERMMFEGGGSMQEMVQGYVNAEQIEAGKRYQMIDEEAHTRLAAFDYFTGNMDRHDKNWMINEATGKIAMIDNGMTFTETAKANTFSAPLAWANDLNMPITPEIKEWAGKWPDIEVYLKDNGFTAKEIQDAGDRLEKLANATSFPDLMKQESDAFNVLGRVYFQQQQYNLTPDERAYFDAVKQANIVKNLGL